MKRVSASASVVITHFNLFTTLFIIFHKIFSGRQPHHNISREGFIEYYVRESFKTRLSHRLSHTWYILKIKIIQRLYSLEAGRQADSLSP
jgi:hypothetical protein